MADNEKPVENTEENSEDTSKDEEKVSKDVGMKKAKSTAKTVKKEEEDDEESEEEENPGLYDKPLVIEGKRERKKTVFLVKDENERKKPEPLLFNGSGDALGKMEVVNHEISQSTAFELKPLHKLLFGRDGRATEIKKNIRLFNGFKIEEGSKEYENKKFGLEKFTNEGLKRLLEILDLEKKGTREDYKERLFSFLLNPKETGRSLKALQKKNENKKKKSEGKGNKRKRPASKKPSKEKSKNKKEEDLESENESDNDDSDDDEEPKKKKAKSETQPKVKSTPSKTKQKPPAKSKKDEKKKSPKAKSKPVAVKITSGKRTPKKTPIKKVPIDEDSSDDEPLSKKAKKQEPTNEELAKTVKDLLKDADLDEITVKSVSKDVFAKYPDFDLSEKKGFIKETIYSVIAGDTD